jgi:hypothetical protein
MWLTSRDSSGDDDGIRARTRSAFQTDFLGFSRDWVNRPLVRSGSCKSAAVRNPTMLTLAVAAILGATACSSDSNTAESEPRSTASSSSPTTKTVAVTTTTLPPDGARFCDVAEPTQTGALQDPALIEVSGVVASQRHPGVFWVHNDSGDQARIFAIDLEGKRLGEFRLDGITAVDWEDIALIPKPESTDGADEIVIADIGDNAGQRETVSLIYLDEPDLPDDPAEPVVIDASVIEYTYADGPHDAEAIFYDSDSARVAIVSKAYVDTPGLYLPSGLEIASAEPVVLKRAGDVVLGAGQLATSAEASFDGSAILVRTYSDVFVYERTPGETAATALAREPCTAAAAVEQQGEAIAVTADDLGYVTISEGKGAPIWEVTTQ